MDYSGMKARETSKKRVDIDFSVSKRTKNKIKRSMKKSTISWLAVIMALIVGGLGGFFAHKYAFRNDTFKMLAYSNGEIDICIGSDEEFSTYTEMGVKCIVFGKDMSKDCTIKYYYRADLTEEQVEVDSIDTSTAGMYYAVYTTSTPKYKTVTLIRNIMVMREEL